MEGTTRWFNQIKGYGFIQGEDSNDYFAHFSEIKTNGFKTLEVGQRVRFDPGKSDKGRLAKDITIIF